MNEQYPWLVVAPVGALAILCVVHVLLSRAMSPPRPYLALLSGILTGLGAAVGTTFAVLFTMGASVTDAVGFAFLNLLTYLALAFGYLCFVNMNITSLRIRSLSEILQAGGALPRLVLLDRYSTNRMISRRIDVLAGNGHIIERNGRYFLGKRQLLLIAAVFDGMRRLVLGRKRAEGTMGLPLPETKSVVREVK